MSIDDTIRRIVREEIRAALEERDQPSVLDETPAGLLGTKDAAELLGIAQRTLYDWRVDRKGPPAVKYGRLVKYRREDLDQWITDHRQ